MIFCFFDFLLFIIPYLFKIKIHFSWSVDRKNGADGGDQTHDLSLTKRLLYQLSYIGVLF